MMIAMYQMDGSELAQARERRRVPAQCLVGAWPCSPQERDAFLGGHEERVLDGADLEDTVCALETCLDECRCAMSDMDPDAQGGMIVRRRAGKHVEELSRAVDRLRALSSDLASDEMLVCREMDDMVFRKMQDARVRRIIEERRKQAMAEGADDGTS